MKRKVRILELYEVEEKEPFRIQDMSQLDWAFKTLSEITAEDNEIKQRADVQRSQIDKWEQVERGKLTNDMEYFQGIIRVYHQEQLALNPKAKTLSTPFGVSKTRTSEEAPEQADKDTILQHVLDNGLEDLIKYDYKWSDLKKSLKIAEVNGRKVAVDENGAIVEGITIKPESTNYTVDITN